ISRYFQMLHERHTRATEIMWRPRLIPDDQSVVLWAPRLTFTVDEFLLPVFNLFSNFLLTNMAPRSILLASARKQPGCVSCQGIQSTKHFHRKRREENRMLGMRPALRRLHVLTRNEPCMMLPVYV